MSEIAELLEVAESITERAGKLALSYFRQAVLIETKANGTPVTVADKKTEEMIREELMREFPQHGILGEEFGEEVRNSEYLWTIDPIDGTRSFIRGIPLFGTLVGLLHKGEPIVGVMALPALDEIYVSAQGVGTYCNGHQLHVSPTASLSQAIVSIGDISSFDHADKKKYLASIQAKAHLVRGYTDCFGHSLVLRGAVDAMIDPMVSIWDVAPLACLIREAGGDYSTFDGEQSFQKESFLTFTPGLKRELLDA